MGAGFNRRGLLRLLGSGLGLGWVGTAPGSTSVGATPVGAASRPRTHTLDVPLDGIAPGTMIEVEWQDRPVFVRRRTGAEIARERAVPLTELRDPQPDTARVQRPEWVIVEGICTHGGCIPTGPLGDYGGWYCLCHGSQFDTAGRVRAGPARENLKIPAYQFVDERTVRIGRAAGDSVL